MAPPQASNSGLGIFGWVIAAVAAAGAYYYFSEPIKDIAHSDAIKNIANNTAIAKLKDFKAPSLNADKGSQEQKHSSGQPAFGRLSADTTFYTTNQATTILGNFPFGTRVEIITWAAKGQMVQVKSSGIVGWVKQESITKLTKADGSPW